MKVAKRLLDDDKLDHDILLLVDEMYLEKEEQYQNGEVYGSNEDGELYKGVVIFQIVGIQKNIPVVIKVKPETKITGKWLKSEMEESIGTLNKMGFRVRGVLADNYSSNVSGFSYLISSYDTHTLSN